MADESMVEGPTPADGPPPEGAAPGMTEAQVGEWMNRLKASEDVVRGLVDREHDGWKRNVQAYMGKVLSRTPDDLTVAVPLEFSYVELKKAQLAFQVPEVHLKPRNPQSAAAVPVFQAAVNHELSEENADAPTLIDEVATDVLLCGIAFSKIGYSADVRTRQVPVMQPVVDPTTGQPQMDPQTQQPVMAPAVDPMTQQPLLKDEQFLAHEEYFWRRFPAEQGLLPVDFEDSNFDRAGWVAMKFVEDFEQAKKAYDLPDDFAATIQTPRDTLSSDERPARGQAGASLKQVEGYEVWYQAAVFAPADNPLPKQIKQLVLINGHTLPVVHRDSPYQWIGEDGKLKGMEGFPIHPLVLRFLPGSAYPVSDVGIARPISEEISMGRTQMMRFRDRALPMQWYDRSVDGIDPDTLAKLKRGEIMARIGVDGNGGEKFGVVALPQFPRENFTFDEIGKRDYESTWAMRPPALDRGEAPTATEVNTSQAVSDVRLDKERTKFLRWFTSGATKFASLLQRFADDARYAEIEGPDGAKAMQAWDRKAIQGEFVFKAKPDSALRIDADVERRQSRDLYNLLGRDPNVNRVELLNTVLARHNMDPAKIVVQTPPPETKPEPPRVSYTFRGDDFALLTKDGLPNTAFPIVMAIAAAGGMDIPPDAVQNAKLLAQQAQGLPPMPGQPPTAPGAPGPPQLPAGNGAPSPAPHGGPMPQAQPINKHLLAGGGDTL